MVPRRKKTRVKVVEGLDQPAIGWIDGSLKVNGHQRGVGTSKKGVEWWLEVGGGLSG